MTTPKTNPMQFEITTGPWTNLTHTYCGQMDAAFKAAEPMLHALGRVQVEWTHLATARSRAWANLPGALSHCRSPADVASLQIEFWQTATRNYMEGWQRIWSATATLTSRGGEVASGPASAKRDVLAVPDAEAAQRNRQAA